MKNLISQYIQMYSPSDLELNNYIYDICSRVSEINILQDIIDNEIKRLSDIRKANLYNTILKLKEFNGRYFRFSNRDDEVYFLKFEITEDNIIYAEHYGDYFYLNDKTLYYDFTKTVDILSLSIRPKDLQYLCEITEREFNEISEMYSDYFDSLNKIDNKLNKYID